MFNCFDKIQINYNILTCVLVLISLLMSYLELSVLNYTLASLPHESRLNLGSEDIEINSYPLMPTNISVMPESLPTGHLYLSSILPIVSLSIRSPVSIFSVLGCSFREPRNLS